MVASKKTLRKCPVGHEYMKSSDCPVCPICDRSRTLDAGFLQMMSAPARRALEGAGIKSLKTLSTYSEADLLLLHGFGPGSIVKLKEVLKKEGLSFNSK